jgi:O-antigen/teichoic acid export membrane protein
VSDLKGFFWAFAQSVWAALLAIIVVPFYIKALGLEGYGLIGFFVSLQALIVVFDFGLTPTISREAARLTQLSQNLELKKTIFTLEMFVLLIAFLTCLLLMLFSSKIATNWLQAKQILLLDLTQALSFMAIAVAARLPIGFYHGLLIGMRDLKLSSQFHIVFGTLSSLGAIFILFFVSASVVTFFKWQAFVALVHLVCLRMQITYQGSEIKVQFFSIEKLKNVLPFSIPMAGVATTSLIFTQMDRLLLSKILSLDEFATYAAAVLFASGLHVVVMPIFNSIYPKLIAQIEAKKQDEALYTYITISSILVGLLLPAAGFFAFNANFFLSIWTHNEGLSEKAAPILVLLLLGYAINGIMYPAYAMQLANGRPKIPLVINIVLGAFLAPALYYFASRFGMIGAGLSWFGVFSIYLIAGTWITWFYLRLPVAMSVLLQRIVFPTLGLIGLTLVWTFGFSTHLKEIERLVVSAIGALVFCGLQLLSYRDTRAMVFKLVRWSRS